MIKAVVFDAWGTLFESKESSAAFYAINTLLGQAFSDFNYLRIFEAATCLDASGMPENVARRLTSSLGLSVSDEVLAQVSALFETAFTSEVHLFDDAAEMLPELHSRYKLGLLSNSGVQSADNLRKRFPLVSMFDAVLFSYEVGLLKPDSRFFKAILQRLEVQPSEALYVGDHPHVDVEGAMESGIHAILIDRRQRNLGTGLRRCDDLHGILALLAENS